MATVSQETEFKIVAHVVSNGSKGMTARLVLKDDEGFYRVVLGVGEPAPDYRSAVESVVRHFGNRIP